MNWALGDRLQPSIMRVQNFQNVRRYVEDLIMSRTPKELLVAAEISSRLSGKRNVDKLIKEVKRDEMPTSLCICCYNLLQQFSNFKKTCIQSENKLLHLSKSLKLEAESAVVVKEEEDDNFDTSNADFFGDTQIQEKEETALKGDGMSTQKSPKPHTKPHTKFKYICELCSKRFVLKKCFEAHKLTHEGNIATTRCIPCDKTYATRNGLQQHNEMHHCSRSFKDVTCKVCSRVCKTPYTLKAHYKTHEEREARICNECGRQFKSDVTLNNHMETHTKNRQRSFACQHCGKTYVNKKNRAKHLYRRHTDRRFLCHYCNYGFTDKANLIKHIMIHEGTQRLYKCDICFRALASSASLSDHRRIHTGERPFSCSFCLKRFAKKGVMMDHQRTHTGEKPFKCVVCEQNFAQRSSMRRHMKVHDRLK